MSLISINGQNPFAGQRDPYLSLDSSIDYSSSQNESIQHTYILNGVLTGCSKNQLNNLRDDLVNSFDWKNNPSIPSQIAIDGVVAGNQANQLIPVSLDFEQSNYIGSLQYTIKLEVFTGVGALNEEDNDLINKTHTETTTIDEKGLVSISTNISCSPNQNLQDCGSIEAANAWVQQQLGATKLGSITQSKSLPLQNESLKINPISSEVSYSSMHAQEPSDTNVGAPNGTSSFKLALCKDTQVSNEDCQALQKTIKTQGEVYKSGASQDELVSYLNANVLKSGPKSDLSMNYSSQNDTISFSFSESSGGAVNEPEGLLVNDYTVTYNEDFEEPINNTTSVNGTFFILNPKEDSIMPINKASAISRAHGIAGGGKIINQTATENIDEQTVSYSITCGDQPPNDIPTLEGISGLSEYSISFSPSIDQHSITYPIGQSCEPIIQKLTYASRANASISVTVVSGEDFDFQENCRQKMEDIKNLLIGADPIKLRVDEDSENLTVKGESVTRVYSASFDADSVLKDGRIESLK